MIVAEADESAGSHTEEDENYFVSMTDMMVGILFIFIIMLMVFALNFQKQTDRTEFLTEQQREQIEKAKELAQQIADLQAQIDTEISEINKADQARAVLLETIRVRLEAVGLKVTIDSDTGVLRLAEDAIRFAQNSAILDDTAGQNVDSLSRVLADVLPDYAVCATDVACPAATGYVVETVFIEHAIPNGTMKHRGEPVDPKAIRNVALLTVEGENDDITGGGQTEAAHALTPNIPADRRLPIVSETVAQFR